MGTWYRVHLKAELKDEYDFEIFGIDDQDAISQAVDRLKDEVTWQGAKLMDYEPEIIECYDVEEEYPNE